MVSKLILNFVLKNVLKVVATRFKPLEQYVYERNELDESVEKLEYKYQEISTRIDIVLREFQEIKRRKNNA